MTISGNGPVAESASINGLRMPDGAAFYREIDAGQLKRIKEAGTGFVESTEGNPCLVLTGRIIGAGDLGRSTEHRVQHRCEERFGFPKTPPENTINVILDSIGGPLDSAFRTVLYLSRYAETLNVYVPRRAKSASTLMAVGANAIFMSPFAELGPLDTQIRDPRNPADYMSALDCYQSVDYVRDFGFNTLSQALKHLAAVTQGKVTLVDSLNTAEEFAIGSITPMLTQTKSLDFGAWGRSLKIAERYAQLLLSRRPEVDQARAGKIASRLVYGYTHHLFPIDIIEAKDIGLNPKEMTAEQYASLVEIIKICSDDVCAEFIDEPDLTEVSGLPRSRASLEDTMTPQASTAQVKQAPSAKKARPETAASVQE
jgi:Serine dehydrogenase proteinase